MADESSDDKTLPATPRRLEQAREEGNVVRSRELATAAVLMAGIGAVSLGGPLIVQMHETVLKVALRFGHADAMDPARVLARLAMLAEQALLVIVPLGLLLAIAAMGGTLALGGWNLSGKALRFDIARLNPARMLGQLFSGHGAGELGKSLAKTMLFMGLGAWLLMRQAPQFSAMLLEEPDRAVTWLGDAMVSDLLWLGAVIVLIALIDVPLQLWNYYRQLRMTPDEVRREAKELEGDPHVKGRIRSQQREMARKRMMSKVPHADVVVTNPTRYAVALRYAEGRMGAPVVVAKGTGEVAARIRKLADDFKVPRVEAPALARALHKHVELDAEVPAALYVGVAQVLAHIFQLRAARRGEAPEPGQLGDIEVPADLAVPAEAPA